MPVQQPPAQPPAQPVVQQQQQQQQQQPSNNFSPSAEVNPQSSTSSYSDSDNEVVNHQSSVLSNTQINTGNATKYSYGNGITRPVTSLTMSAYRDAYSNDVGLAVGITVPLGRQSARLSDRMINARINTTVIANSGQIASTCANIRSAGFTLNNEVLPPDSPLRVCNDLLVAVQPTVAKTVVKDTSDLEALRSELAAMKEEARSIIVENRKLRQQLDSYYRHNDKPMRDGG